MASTARCSPNDFVSDDDAIAHRSALISRGRLAAMGRLFGSTLPPHTVDCIAHLLEGESMAVAVAQRAVGHRVGELPSLALVFGAALRGDERPRAALDVDQPFALQLPVG